MTEDFGLEREHREFRDAFRRFVTDKVAPLAERGEREQRFPREVYATLRDAGFLGVNFPVEVGGGGGDLLMGCIFYEELTRAGAGVSAAVFAHQHLAAGPVLHFGTEEQRREFLLPALRGERIGAFALTEPDAGSDIRGIKTTARRRDGDFVLNGSKLYITNGSIADFMLVAARTDAARSAGALSMFIVETREPGVTARDLVKVGNHSSSTAFVSLEDVRVPAGRLPGEAGGGVAPPKAAPPGGGVLAASRGRGLAQEAWELIHRYATERTAFGRTIGSFQGVAFKIAEMAARIDAVRLMIYRAARLRMAGHDCIREASMAKFLASEAAGRGTGEGRV